MAQTSEDNALDVLLALHRKDATDLSETLVRQCYQVERAFQYDKDRDVPLDKIRRLVEAEVNARLEAQGEGKRATP